MFHQNPIHSSKSGSRATRVWLTSACLLASVLLAAPTAFADAVAKQVQGQVEIGRGEPPHWTPLDKGDAISSEDRIRTGSDGRVEISMAAGTLRVHENSMLRLPPPSADADRVDLDRGNSLFDILRRGGRRFEVHTPTVVVSVKGTRFGVDASGELGEVAVYHGVVGIREAGIEHAMETLVREGFLATGGAGSPIELDLVPTGDPWASWQDFRREVRETREPPKRANDIDRARSALHRATASEVIERAAKRKPEVAERVREMKQKQAREQADEAGSDSRPDRETTPNASGSVVLPAAPAMNPRSLDPSETKRMQRTQRLENEMMDGVIDQRRDVMQERRRQQKVIEAMTGGEDALNATPRMEGDLPLDPEALQQLQGQVMLDILAAREQVRDAFTESATSVPGFTGWTSTDYTNEMKDALIDMGYDPTTAGTIAGQVTNLLD